MSEVPLLVIRSIDTVEASTYRLQLSKGTNSTHYHDSGNNHTDWYLFITYHWFQRLRAGPTFRPKNKNSSVEL